MHRLVTATILAGVLAASGSFGEQGVQAAPAPSNYSTIEKSITTIREGWARPGRRKTPTHRDGTSSSTRSSTTFRRIQRPTTPADRLDAAEPAVPDVDGDGRRPLAAGADGSRGAADVAAASGPARLGRTPARRHGARLARHVRSRRSGEPPAMGRLRRQRPGQDPGTVPRRDDGRPATGRPQRHPPSARQTQPAERRKPLAALGRATDGGQRPLQPAQPRHHRRPFDRRTDLRPEPRGLRTDLPQGLLVAGDGRPQDGLRTAPQRRRHRVLQQPGSYEHDADHRLPEPDRRRPARPAGRQALPVHGHHDRPGRADDLRHVADHRPHPHAGRQAQRRRPDLLDPAAGQGLDPRGRRPAGVQSE